MSARITVRGWVNFAVSIQVVSILVVPKSRKSSQWECPTVPMPDETGHGSGTVHPDGAPRSVAGGPAGMLERGPLTRLHLAIIALCAFGFAIDLAELALGGALSSIFSAAPYHIDAARLTWLVTSAYVGALIGAPTFGWLADRIGPLKVLCLLTCWIGIWSILSAGAPTVDMLAICRLFAGVGVGAFPPIMIAYLTDIAPREQRGLVIFTACGAAYLAPPLAIFAVRWLTPIAPLGIEGWRWPFAVGGVFALLAGGAMTRLPEAPHWLAATGRAAALRRVADRIAQSKALGLRVRPGEAANTSADGREDPRIDARSASWRLVVLCAISFTVPIATVSFPLLTGPILLARHFSLSDTLFYIGFATFGPVVGTLLGGVLIDGIARRMVMALCAGGMLASVGLFFLASAPVAIAVALVGFALFTSLYMPAMTLYGAELFTPSMRARKTSIAWVANRIAAAGAPAVLVPLVHRQETLAIAAVLAVALLVNLAVVACLAPHERDSADPLADGVG